MVSPRAMVAALAVIGLGSWAVLASEGCRETRRAAEAPPFEPHWLVVSGADLYAGARFPASASVEPLPNGVRVRVDGKTVALFTGDVAARLLLASRE